MCCPLLKQPRFTVQPELASPLLPLPCTTSSLQQLLTDTWAPLVNKTQWRGDNHKWLDHLLPLWRKGPGLLLTHSPGFGGCQQKAMSKA